MSPARQWFTTGSALFLVGMISNGNASSQEALDEGALEPSPLVEQLIRAAPEGDQIVELSGYVGPSESDKVRLYSSLSLLSYVEVSRSEILHVQRREADAIGPVKLYVRGSTKITRATQGTAASSAPQSHCWHSTLCEGGVQHEVTTCSRNGGPPTPVSDIEVGSCTVFPPL
jgi:hypothetical protein